MKDFNQGKTLKRCGLGFLMSAVSAIGLAEEPEDDRMSQLLVGKWSLNHGAPPMVFNGTSHFMADHSARSWLQMEIGERTENVEVHFKWRIEDGALVTEVLESNSAMLSPGDLDRYRILSLDETTFRYLGSAGVEYVERRQH